MTEYKIRVSIDEKNFFFVVVKTDFRPKKVIWNPTEDDLKDTIVPKSYNNTNICPRCREDNEISDKSILCPGEVYHDTDENGEKTGEWVCKIHGSRRYHRYYSGSDTNIKKSVRSCRTGNLSCGRHIFGDICEDLTYKWLGAKKLSIEKDNYTLPLDHGHIPKGISIMIGDKLVDLSEKVPQTKGIAYIRTNGRWDPRIANEHGKNFDVLIVYCANENRNTIERIYIFPYSEVIKRTNITMYIRDSKRNWYESFRVTDEEEVRKVNRILQLLINENKE